MIIISLVIASAAFSTRTLAGSWTIVWRNIAHEHHIHNICMGYLWRRANERSSPLLRYSTIENMRNGWQHKAIVSPWIIFMISVPGSKKETLNRNKGTRRRNPRRRMTSEVSNKTMKYQAANTGKMKSAARQPRGWSQRSKGNKSSNPTNQKLRIPRGFLQELLSPCLN